jgi:hypothetical protein
MYGTHAFVNTSNAPVRIIGMNSPAGHERAFDMPNPTPERLPGLMVALGWRLHGDYDFGGIRPRESASATA